jgi:hypothetical protein
VSARGCLALLMLTAGISLAPAQKISPSDMAGRERERFIESPAERFMKPGPYIAPSVVDLPPKVSKRQARRAHRKHR